MTDQSLERSVISALSAVSHPGRGGNVVDSGRVTDVSVEGGEVRFSFHLHSDDPGDLVRMAREAAEGVDGVESVKVNVQLPQTGGATGPAGPPGGGGEGGGLQPGSVPAPTPQPGLLDEVEHVVAVSSGKGGVGKSMVAANLAAALAATGRRVGLLDADVYGPNVPRMFGESRRPRVTGSKGQEKIQPLEAHGVRLMSLGFLLEEEQPAIMRGPLISGILKQFLEQVEWGALDYLVVDMPPGTGDAQLSLVQTIDIDGAVMVTTPQDMSTGDVRRAIKMFERVNTRVLGLVENMSGYTCPHCGETEEIFGSGGGERLAADMGVALLGKVPLDAAVRTAGDMGVPTIVAAPDSAAGKALRAAAQELEQLVEPAVAGA